MLRLRGDVWWVRFYHRGRRVELSTGQRNRRAAEAEARKIQTRVCDGKPAERPGRPCGVTLDHLEALDLLRVENEGLSRLRRQTIEGLWRPLIGHFGERLDCQTLTVGAVVAYVGERRKPKKVKGKDRPGARGQTIKREVEALVRALRIAKRDRILKALPFDPEDLPPIRHDPKLESQRGKLWRREQIEAVLSNLSAKAVTAGHRDRCRLIMLTGLRIEELHRLQREWVVPTMPGARVPALLHIPDSAAKWGKERTVPLVPEALEIVDRCAPFPRRKPNKSLARASSDAGLPGVLTPRDLRTWFLSTVGAEDQVAAQWLGGHTNIATTGLYLKSTEERAIDAVLRLDRGRCPGTVAETTAPKTLVAPVAH